MSGQSRCNQRSEHRYQRREIHAIEHCCVPLCGSSSRCSSALSFHCFPKDAQLRRQWVRSVRSDPLVVTSHRKVCSRHFSTHDIMCDTSDGQRTLKPGAVPSLFPWNNFTRPEEEEEEDEEEEEEGAVAAALDHDYCVSRHEEEAEHRGRCGPQPLLLHRFAASPEDIRFYTRFSSLDHLMAFWTLIEPATSWIGRAERVTGAGEQDDSSTPTKLAPIDEFFLFLNYLSTGRTQRELGRRFKIHQTTVCTIIVTWANFLHRLLGSACIWMTPEKVKAHLPREFKDYADTQVVIDSFKLHCRAPSSQFAQRDDCSSRGSHLTSKAMVGMAPHGAVTFVSVLFEGFVSDKEIFRQSGIIPLLTSDMAVMVDEGFPVDDLVPGKVHQLGSSAKRNQLSEHEIQPIAPVMDHVEKLFQRIQEYKLFDTNIPLNVSGSVNQLFTVACLLCNYQNQPLGKK